MGVGFVGMAYRKIEPVTEIQLAADLGTDDYFRLEDRTDSAKSRDLCEVVVSGLLWKIGGTLTENPGIAIEGIGAL